MAEIIKSIDDFSIKDRPNFSCHFVHFAVVVVHCNSSKRVMTSQKFIFKNF